MTKYITRIWQFLIKKSRRTWILIHDSLCPCQKSVKIWGIMLPRAYSWDFFTSDLHTSKICWPIFTHTPCNNFISSTEDMLVLHKDSFTGLKFHYKYSRLRGTQMFLSTLLQKKIIDFIQFEMFMSLALKTPKTVRIYMVKTWIWLSSNKHWLKIQQV